MKWQKFFFRLFFYALGLMFIAFGTAISINSDLGVTPVGSLPYVVSQVSGIDLGVCVTLVLSSYILIQIFILRKEFKWINITQILFSTMFGFFVDFARIVVGDFVIPGYPGRLLMIAIATILVAIGVVIYANTKLVNMPPEGLANALVQKFPKRAFYQMKIVVDSTGVLIAIAISLLVFGRLYGVREGTIISAILVGQVIKFIQKPIKNIIEKICFKEAA
ncbi:MAG: DUF6198 family protein [Treponema sp.]|nr:DUF6198 family protein [Treponema sp.]